MRSEQLKNNLIALLGPDSSPIHDSLILAHLNEIQDAQEKEKKRHLILIKLLADHIEFLKKCITISPNKSLAEDLLSRSEALFNEEFPHLKNSFPQINLDSLSDQRFYQSQFISLTERDMILVDEMRIKCAIANKLAAKNPAPANDPNKAFIEKISMVPRINVAEGQYSQSKAFMKNASQHFTSYASPLLKFLQSSLIGSLGKAVGKNAQFEALDQIEATDTVKNANPFVAEEAKRFQSQFGTGWGFLFNGDLMKFNTALSSVQELKERPDATQEVSRTLRTQMKSLSRGAKVLTRATTLLQESFRLILKAYVNAPELNQSQLSQLAGFFLEMPFSNKDWGLAYAVLRKNFSKLTYESKLKVISAAVLREEKKEDPSKIITNLIWQAYASNPDEYSNQKGIGKEEPVSLQNLNMRHYNFINDEVPDSLDDYLSDLPDLFDYANNAKSKIPTALKERELAVKKLSDEKDICEKNFRNINTLKDALNVEFNECAERYQFKLEGNSIEDRLSALESRYNSLVNDAFSTEEKKALSELIDKAKLTLELEKDRRHIHNNSALSTFYSELSRGLNTTFGAHFLISSGIVERRHVPTVYAGAFLDQLGNLLSMPVVSGVLSGVGSAIEHFGSFKLKHNADTLSRITTSNTQLERLMEKITILLTLHLEDELKKYEPESVKKIADFCQKRCVALVLIHAGTEDWRDLDKAAEKYFKLITAEVTKEESMIEKVKMLFHSITSLGAFRLKTVKENETRKTIVEVVTKTPPKSPQNTRKTHEENSKKPAQRPTSKLRTGLQPTAAIQAQELKLSQMQHDLRQQGEKITRLEEKNGQLADRVSALEKEKEKLEKESAAQRAELARLSANNTQLERSQKTSEAALRQLEEKNSDLEEKLAEFSQQNVIFAEALLTKSKQSAVALKSSKEKPLTPSQIDSPFTPQTRKQDAETDETSREIETFTKQVSVKRSESRGQFKSKANPLTRRSLAKDFSNQSSTLPTSASAPAPKSRNLLELVNKFNEILTSEQNFCGFLKTLSTSFTNSTDRQALTKIIGEVNFNHISQKIEKIGLLSENPFSEIALLHPENFQTEDDLLAEFKARLSILLQIIQDVDITYYRTTWIKNLSKDLHEINALASDDRCAKIFDSFVNLSNKATRFAEIYSMPTQRLSRYVLFFTEMGNALDKFMDEKGNAPNDTLAELKKTIILANRYSDAQTKMALPEEETNFKLFQMAATEPVKFPDVWLSGKIYIQKSNNILHYAVVYDGKRNQGTISTQEIANQKGIQEKDVNLESISSYYVEILNIISNRGHIPKRKSHSPGSGFFRPAIRTLSQANLKSQSDKTLDYTKNT